MLELNEEQRRALGRLKQVCRQMEIALLEHHADVPPGYSDLVIEFDRLAAELPPGVAERAARAVARCFGGDE